MWIKNQKIEGTLLDFSNSSITFFDKHSNTLITMLLKVYLTNAKAL